MSIGWYATYNDFGATWGKAIGAVGIAIYQSLASRAWDGQCFPSYQTIADDTGVSRPTAIKYIKKLQKAGLIEVQPRYNRRGDPSSNLYTLSNLPSLKKPQIPEKIATPPAIADTSNLSEAEIAELARKSHFVSRPKKNAVAQPTATVASNEQYSGVEVAEKIAETAPTQLQTAPQTAAAAPPSTPKKSLNFGLLTNEKDQIAALHLLKGVTNKQEVLDELNKAIREKRIQTTEIQYLGGLVKKVMRGEFTPSANIKTEDELLVEKKQQAAERDKAAKEAIAECPICNRHGYLVFNEISETAPLHYQSAICSHDQKSKAFTEKLLAREKKGEVVTFFGKGSDPDTFNQAEAVKAINDAIALLSITRRSDANSVQAKTKTTAPPATPASTTQSEPAVTSKAASAQTTITVPLAEATTATVAPPQNDPAPVSEQPASSDTETGYGFRSIGQAIESALEKKLASTPPAATTQAGSETSTAEAAESEEQPLEELTAEEMAELELEISELVEDAEQILPAQERAIALTSDEEDERKLKLKIETVQAEIDQLYANEMIITEHSILRYLKLQTRVKLARARLLVLNHSTGERSRSLALQHLAAITQVYPELRSIKYTRQNLKVVEQIIEMLRRTKPSEQLDNLIRERNILRKGLADQEADAYSWRDMEGDSPEQLRVNHKRNLDLRRGRAIALIEDEHPELRGEFLKLDELLPEHLKLTPLQVELLRKYEAERAQNKEK